MFCSSTATAPPFSSLSTVVDRTSTSSFGFGIVNGTCGGEQRLAGRPGLGGLVLGGLAGRQRRGREQAGDDAHAHEPARDQPNAPLTYSRVRFAFGDPNTSSALSYSTRSPRYMNATRSATR